MWIGIILFVCLGVEVISYVRGDQEETGNSNNEVAWE